jgi:hypothetical protein
MKFHRRDKHDPKQLVGRGNIQVTKVQARGTCENKGSRLLIKPIFEFVEKVEIMSALLLSLVVRVRSKRRHDV